jgi:hypothetical protein
VPAAPRPRSHRLSPGPKNKCAPLSLQCRSCQGHLSKQHQAPRPRFSPPARLRAYRVKPRKPSRVAGENMRKIIQLTAAWAPDDEEHDAPGRGRRRSLQPILAFNDNFIPPSSNSSLLAGKIQGNLPISPAESSQMVQNIERITIPYERTPGALEQGNLGSHQGIELGNQLLSGKELSLASVGICAK